MDYLTALVIICAHIVIAIKIISNTIIRLAEIMAQEPIKIESKTNAYDEDF